MVEIIPAVMPEDLGDLKAKLSRVVNLVPIVQIDLMDGVYVAPTTWPYSKEGQKEFKKLTGESDWLPFWEDVDAEIDLMVKDPEKVLPEWIKAGARRLVVHAESTKNLKKAVELFRETVGTAEHDEGLLGAVEIGVSVGVDTPLDLIESVVHDIDYVQVMGIARIGYQGEPFDVRALEQISNLRQAHPETIISVDGGVNLKTAPFLARLGVERLVIGSALFGSENIEETVRAFRRIDTA